MTTTADAAKIASLEEKLGTISPEAQAELDGLKAQAQALDDIVPDAPSA